MPIYEYQCEKVSEILVGVFQSKAEIKCRHCQSKEVVKKISRGFVSIGSKTKQGFWA